MYESTKKLLSPLPYEKTKIAMIWIIGIVAIAFVACDCFAQSTPDWRPINRVYKNDGVTVGSVGSAGQIKAGHVLTAKSFPASVKGVDKLAFWNLSANSNDSSGETSCTGQVACNLDNIGSVAFTATNLFGVQGAALFAGSPNSLYSDLSLYNPGNGYSMSYGGWFYMSNWNPGSTQVLIGNAASASELGYAIYVNSTGGVVAYGTNTGNNADTSITLGNLLSAGWHHLAVTYDFSNKALIGYLDGRRIASAYLANQRSVSPSRFRIGGQYSSATNYFVGAAQDCFMLSTAILSDQDIQRLASTRIDHNKNLIAKRQDWHFKHQHLGIAGNPHQTLPFLWHDPTDANSLFVDFSDFDTSDKVDIRLYDLQQ